MSHKTKAEYTESEYLDEIVRLWDSVCCEVYLKKPTAKQLESVRKYNQLYWTDSNWTPLQIVLRNADPDYPTNEIERGQKARQKRWKSWVKKHENQGVQ